MDEKKIRETVEAMRMNPVAKAMLLRRALAGEQGALFVISAQAKEGARRIGR